MLTLHRGGYCPSSPFAISIWCYDFLYLYPLFVRWVKSEHGLIYFVWLSWPFLCISRHPRHSLSVSIDPFISRHPRHSFSNFVNSFISRRPRHSLSILSSHLFRAIRGIILPFLSIHLFRAIRGILRPFLFIYFAYC